MAPQDPSMIHSFNAKAVSKSLTMPLVIGIILVAIILGVGTGFGISTISGSKSSTSKEKSGSKEVAASDTSAGVKDKKAFPDEAEGKLLDEGFEGEGSHHLERPGGESQNVYLTSSTVDLSKFIGKKVIVWGQTFESKKAGWLMDVGYIEIIK